MSSETRALLDAELGDLVLDSRDVPRDARLDADPKVEGEDARMASLGRLLRGIGSAVLLAAASTFLLQHWPTGDDLARYAGLLALTALLSGAGFFTGIRLGETRGARTFLALAAALVPAHFCILGGLVYSQWALGSGPHPVPGYATWVAPSPLLALAAPLGALLVLAPVTFVSMLTLARSQARRLTAAMLGLGALLLVPTRDAGIAAALLAVAAATLAALELRVLRHDLALRTLEGVLVRAMLLASPVLLVLRSVLHYEVTYAFGAVVSASAAALAFAVSRAPELPERGRRLLERASVLPAGWACFCGALAMEAAGLPEPAVLPLAALPFACVLAGMGSVTSRDGGPWRRAAAAIAVAAMALNLVLFENAFASFACLAVSIPTLAYGHASGRQGLLVAGGAGALFALAHHVHAAIQLYAWSSWGSLALLGVAVIVGASLLERHHRVWGARLDAWRQRMRS